MWNSNQILAYCGNSQADQTQTSVHIWKVLQDLGIYMCRHYCQVDLMMQTPDNTYALLSQ